MNVTTPPATGSTAFLAATVTASGLPKESPVATLCGVLPMSAARMNPWLWNAPMSGWGESKGLAALVPGDSADGRALPDGEAAGQEGHGLGGSAVVAPGEARSGANADDVAIGAARNAARAAGADQVVRAGDAGCSPCRRYRRDCQRRRYCLRQCIGQHDRPE